MEYEYKYRMTFTILVTQDEPEDPSLTKKEFDMAAKSIGWGIAHYVNKRFDRPEDKDVRMHLMLNEAEYVEQRQIVISDHEIGDRMYAIVHDDIHDTYDISKHRITDICMSGTIITDGLIGDDLSETWTKKDQEFYHVCFSEKEAEKIKAELEANNGTER